MFDIVVAILPIIITFVLMDVFFPDMSSDPAIQRRLQGIKDFDSKRMNLGSDELFKSLSYREKLKKSNLLEMLKENSDYRIQFIGVIFNKFKFVEKIKYSLKIADIKMPVDIFFMLVCFLIVPFVIIGMLNNNIMFLVIGILAGTSPFIYIRMKFLKRRELFTQQFPDALGIVSNSLRAGHSLLSAFQTVAAESEYPINKIFKSVSDEISLGREVRDTLISMTDNLPGSQDLKFFITAVLIQREVGGNLAEILDNLNNTIRERYKLLGMIKTQTAQAQLSGIVLGLAPVVIATLINFINPSYMKPLFTTDLGGMALGLSFGMTVLGFFIIKKVTEIRV
ncbi:MAG: hypothetical protein A2Y25_10555 [Candidatus Melainabacteria bacterium GWF2_37_15]|nr:MAG: hypothetical protein A2Y25_10555 [Candidatus Melainabacteria bacterium GWF2_37_15]